ncbi:NAD(P)H-binding protein [Streptomyces sp. NPDC004284]|uniref:NAD(P)H-binding protein n=1 Tax=Streptomyces sp. NPDC004284 TaxID=3364695 RepID=UPI0036B66A65
MILITGATGNIGHELVRELDTKGVEVRTLIRDPARATALPARADRVVGDLDEPATLAPAFAGVDKLFLLTPGIGTDHAVAAAKAAGVSHIVHLSSANVLGDPMPAMGRWHHEREEIVRACGIPATILRPGGFMTNALEWAPTIREEGYVLDPVGPGRYAPIDPVDIAAVAALVLTQSTQSTQSTHQNKEYVLTGDEALTVTEQAQIIAATIGRTIEVREALTPAQAIRSRFPDGVPQALADAIIEGFTLMRADIVGFRTDTVENLLGRKPQTFAHWCARNADAFRPAANA